jgi:hypothetical protein
MVGTSLALYPQHDKWFYPRLYLAQGVHIIAGVAAHKVRLIPTYNS